MFPAMTHEPPKHVVPRWCHDGATVLPRWCDCFKTLATETCAVQGFTNCLTGFPDSYFCGNTSYMCCRYFNSGTIHIVIVLKLLSICKSVKEDFLLRGFPDMSLFNNTCASTERQTQSLSTVDQLCQSMIVCSRQSHSKSLVKADVKCLKQRTHISQPYPLSRQAPCLPTHRTPCLCKHRTH